MNIYISDRRLNSRLGIFGKAVAGRVAINTRDLVQPLRQTHHADLLISPLLLWLIVLMYTSILFFQKKTIRDLNYLHILSRFKLIPLQLTFSCC